MNLKKENNKENKKNIIKKDFCDKIINIYEEYINEVFMNEDKKISNKEIERINDFILYMIYR